VLLHGGGRELALKFLDECGDMDWLNAGELADPAGLAPGREAARGIYVRLVRVVVVDLGGEEFEDALGGFWGRCEQRGREKHGGGRGGKSFSSHHHALCYSAQVRSLILCRINS
jgi:hypothetical protein